MNKGIALALTGALALTLASSPASATTPKYPAYKETVTQVGPGPLSISVRQLDRTHTAFNLRAPHRVGSKSTFILEHFVCASRSTWQAGRQATSTCTPRTAAHSIQFRYTPSGGIVATFAHGGPSYVCVGRVTGSIKAKRLACLAGDTSTPRASHGSGRYVLNPNASSHADVATNGLELTGLSGTSLGYDTHTYNGYTTDYFSPYVHNPTAFPEILRSIWPTTITTSDPVGCPASEVTVTDYGPNGTQVPALLIYGAPILPGDTANFLPLMILTYPATCQEATITVGLASN